MSLFVGLHPALHQNSHLMHATCLVLPDVMVSDQVVSRTPGMSVMHQCGK